MNTTAYIEKLNKLYRTGQAREHAHRPALQSLLETHCKGITVINEPARISCGAPDLILTRSDIPVGYVEAKDIGISLEERAHKDQFTRYKASLDNLVFTDYLDFHFYRDGMFTTSIRIGEVKGGGIVPLPDRFDRLESLLYDFAHHKSQSIKAPKKLAELMAGKARLLADVIESAVDSDVASKDNTELQQQMKAFKDVLIHDITPREFADLYAQTIAYGMFAARLHDTSLDTFTRQEAAALIPKSNPFLRKLFQNVAGYDLDTRIVWIVDLLADVFRAADVAAILKNFGRSTRQEDPMIHFYETFLAAYDPALRKARGVWYTPEPVVKFIVRAVDDLLKSEFGLSAGLADTSKTRIEVTTQSADARFKERVKRTEVEVHKVQILDPATGTGTFLAEVARYIHEQFEGQQGIWSRYVEEHLLPRVNGFELLMASYAMAHLKLDLLLTETGYTPKGAHPPRLRVYLTNSLEEHHPDAGTLFASWLSEEANQANAIKRDTPVMVVLGNPPYSGISTNNGEWISGKIDDYKYVDGVHFGERKHWLGDDYVKFIRYGEHFIEKGGEGILAYINNHSFLDNPTFRGMRWHLLQTFDEIYIIDLHGNAKKKEVAPDGSADKNVFDIQQGVSINLFVKTGRKKAGALAKVVHKDLWGSREGKYEFLLNTSLAAIRFKKVKAVKPFYFLIPKNDEGQKEYALGFRMDELFSVNSVGIVTARDSFCIDNEIDDLRNRIEEFANLSKSDLVIAEKFALKDTSTFKLSSVRRRVAAIADKESFYQKIAYRPFDERNIFFQNDVVERSLMKVMQHLLNKKNVGLVIGRQGQVVGTMPWNLVFVTDAITDFNLYYRGGGMVFPLYFYQQDLHTNSLRTPNLNDKIVTQIAAGLHLTFTPEKEHSKNTFAPIDLLDYIYAVLHSPAYRERYKEFLKIDFPRVPYPASAAAFWRLAKLGGELRGLHLLESPAVEKLITKYPVDGDNEVVKPLFIPGPDGGTGKVYISDVQYFEGVPEAAWNFYIGGYQPAQKWLKDRRGRALSYQDIHHYQEMIVALTESTRIMAAIDAVGVA